MSGRCALTGRPSDTNDRTRGRSAVGVLLSVERDGTSYTGSRLARRHATSPSEVPGQYRSTAAAPARRTTGAQHQGNHDRVVGVAEHRHEVGHHVDRTAR